MLRGALWLRRAGGPTVPGRLVRMFVVPRHATLRQRLTPGARLMRQAWMLNMRPESPKRHKKEHKDKKHGKRHKHHKHHKHHKR